MIKNSMSHVLFKHDLFVCFPILSSYWWHWPIFHTHKYLTRIVYFDVAPRNFWRDSRPIGFFFWIQHENTLKGSTKPTFLAVRPTSFFWRLSTKTNVGRQGVPSTAFFLVQYGGSFPTRLSQNGKNCSNHARLVFIYKFGQF